MLQKIIPFTFHPHSPNAHILNYLSIIIKIRKSTLIQYYYLIYSLGRGVEDGVWAMGHIYTCGQFMLIYANRHNIVIILQLKLINFFKVTVSDINH